MLISMILKRVPLLKVLLTSTQRLTATAEFNEDIIILKNLNRQQSALLFKSMTGRQITQTEINQLLRTKPDFEHYPEERGCWPYKWLHDHHLFTLLNGNPQSIMLSAPLLADNEKQLSLVDLYQKLTSNEIYQILKSEKIEDKMA